MIEQFKRVQQIRRRESLLKQVGQASQKQINKGVENKKTALDSVAPVQQVHHRELSHTQL